MKTETPLGDSLKTGTSWLTDLSGTIIFLCQPTLSSSAQNPPAPYATCGSHPAHLSEGASQQIGLTVSGWDGSAEGKAYSEFNHRLAGVFVVLIGLSELHGAWGITAWSWLRFLLPGSMLAAGTYLVVWSDHEAWPIGSRTFMDTFSLDDIDIITLQHGRALYPGQQASHAPRSVQDSQQADGRKRSENRITRLAILPLAYVNQWVANATGRPPRIALESLKMAKYTIHDGCCKAIRELGLPQTRPEVAREKAVRWFRSHDYP